MDKEKLQAIKKEEQKKLPKQELDPEHELPKPSIIDRAKSLANKKVLTIIGLIVVLSIAGLLLKKFVFKSAPKQLYSVAVVVRSQSTPDPDEDRRSSLKKGDVLLVTDADHTWSRSEKISYLILKMELTEDQMRKLTQPEERELDEDELSEEERVMIEEEKKRAKEADKDYEREPRTEVLRAREYQIDLSDKIFEGFEANDLIDGQPYSDQIFDWGIVKKKISVEKELKEQQKAKEKK